ncbi:hypothetical protein C8K36_106146 [Rhodococcus sp. OK519]|nr:hypothetical protein C8K36_106146 [Rhodococcus sp. OK519]
MAVAGRPGSHRPPAGWTYVSTSVACSAYSFEPVEAFRRSIRAAPVRRARRRRRPDLGPLSSACVSASIARIRFCVGVVAVGECAGAVVLVGGERGAVYQHDGVGMLGGRLARPVVGPVSEPPGLVKLRGRYAPEWARGRRLSRVSQRRPQWLRRSRVVRWPRSAAETVSLCCSFGLCPLDWFRWAEPLRNGPFRERFRSSRGVSRESGWATTDHPIAAVRPNRLRRRPTQRYQLISSL